MRWKFSSPHGDFSFSIDAKQLTADVQPPVFVPSRGFLFFYCHCFVPPVFFALFSSPHGDFSFSIGCMGYVPWLNKCFRPLTGISLFLCSVSLHSLSKFVFVPSRGFLFFYVHLLTCQKKISVFVPSRGFLFFYEHYMRYMDDMVMFSSPHGDFSFSIKDFAVDDVDTKFSSPHGDFSFSM